MGSRPVVGVMGGGDVPEDVLDQAEQLGRRIAERDWTLLNGGRDEGVMAASANGANRAGGRVIGILPGHSEDDEIPSEDLTVPVYTGLGDARNVVNVLSSDVVVACRGGTGTLSEVALAVRAGRPVILLDWPDEEVPAQVEDAVERVGSARAAVQAINEHVDDV